MSFRGISLNCRYAWSVYGTAVRCVHARVISTHLKQLLQKRDEVGPLVHVIKRSETLLDLLRVLLVLGIGAIRLLQGC